MNFHFSQNKPINIINKSPLLNELAQIEKEISMKQKLLQKSRLQAEFYQEQANMPSTNKNKNNNALADDIMNELLNKNNSPKKQQRGQNQNIYYPQNNQRNIQNYYNHPNFQEASIKNNKFSANNLYSNQSKQTNQKYLIKRQNRMMNQRQLQKMKLQDQVQKNPFTQNTQPVKRSIQNNYSSNKPIVNQREQQKRKLQNQAENYGLWENNNNRKKKSPQLNNFVVRQNNFIQPNQRQFQKLKLQHQPNQGMFGAKERQQKSPNNLIPQNDRGQSHKRALKDNYSNPFLKDQHVMKQKRQEQQREYRRVLQEQKRIQQQRKNKQKQQIKAQKYAFNNYDPSQNVYQPIITSKKTDPNAKRPQIKQIVVQKATSSDLQYMKIKASEIKQKYKKGRILYDQYLQQTMKLADYYKVDYKELIDKKDMQIQGNQQPWIKEIKRKYNKDVKSQQQKRQAQITQQRQIQNHPYEQLQRFQILEREQSLQKLPQSQRSLEGQTMFKRPQTYKYYQQSQLASNLSNQYANSANYQTPYQNIEIVQKLLSEMKQMKQIYTKNMQNDKMFLQQTFIKVLANNQHQKQLLTQHFLLSTNQQMQAKSQSQQPQKYKKILQKQFTSESQSKDHITDQPSYQYIDKSLSGIVNKIPMTKQQIQKQSGPSFKKPNVADKSKALEDFFNKQYIKKKFKNFSIMVDLNQSTLQVPNVSNFLCLKNGKQTTSRLFEEDLILMKKLQTGKQIKQLKERVNKQYSYNQTFNNRSEATVKTNQEYQQYESYRRQQKPSQIKSSYQHRSYKKIVVQEQEDKNSKLFLKKHISEDSQNQMQQIPTFAEQSDIKIRSPVYYSPKLNSQILEQDEYQTSSKHNPIKSPTQKDEPKYYFNKKQGNKSPNKNQPLLNIIKNHDNILAQQQQSPKNEVDIKDYSSINSKDSRNYFSNNNLSPIKNNNQYQQSLETVKSYQESMKFNRKQIKQLNKQPSINYSQTVESVQQSSSHMVRPPFQKRKSTSRKKQSSIARTKIQKQSILIKPPPSENQSINYSKNQAENYKFDSHVYESEYDQTYDHQSMKKVDKNLNLKKQRTQKSPDLHVNPPVIITSASNLHQGNEQKQSNLSQQGKLKSLQQARNMAKQFKRRSVNNEDSHDHSRMAQQKMSQLQSFLTKRDDSLIMKRQERSKQKQVLGKQKKVKNTNIMKLLDDLQNQSYKDDFQSYREESQC